MIGEVNSFRKRFFGGFNQSDVVDYIAKLSKERNTHREEVLKLADEATTLRHQLERIQLLEPDAHTSKHIAHAAPFNTPVVESVVEPAEEPIEEHVESPTEPYIEQPVSGLRAAVDSVHPGEEAMQKLADEAAALYREFEEAKAIHDDRAQAFESAEKTFLELKNAFASARLSIETAHGFIRSELANAELPIIALPPVIEKTEEHLEELRSFFVNSDDVELLIPDEDDPFSLLDSKEDAQL